MSERNCKCPVCGIEALEQDQINYFAKRYSCQRCGEFIIENDTIDLFSDSMPSSKLKACLFWFLSQNVNSKIKQKPIPHIFSSSWEEGIAQNHHFISTRTLLNLFPNTINEQLDMILVNLGNAVKYIGDELIINFTTANEVYPIFFVKEDYSSKNSKQELRALIEILEEGRFIKTSQAPLGDFIRYYTLTAKAWSTIQNIQKNLEVSNTAFIAMWFNDQMKGARESIFKAITDCGYFPVIIDEKEYNNFIVPEILYEIEKSRFVIADFTGSRGGVYYEAGYAKGLKKEVIMTCKDDCFNPHFDTQQVNHIIWKSEEDLYNRLVNRIKATIR